MTDPGAERIPDPAPQQSPLWIYLSVRIDKTEHWLRSRGGPWLRRSIQAFWALIAFVGVVLLFGPVINKPISLDDITSAAHSVTDRWIAREFAVDYRISTAPDGTLAAQVEERINAHFPEGTGDEGIQRVLATQYEGHALSPSDITATLDGNPIEVTRSDTADRTILSMAHDKSLSDDHQFVLRYSLQNLAYSFEDERLEKPVDLLEWDVFGPSWPQGFSGLDVSISLPQQLADHLVRAPRGALAWTLVGDGHSLTPEPNSKPGEVTYRFTNDQRIPPHAQAWFTMSFDSGTFTMPEPNVFYWVQVFGPAVPLAFLLFTLLFAFAARAVAWSDERGRPWFVAQFDPPDGVTPRMAAQILAKPAPMELAQALYVAQKPDSARSSDHSELVAAAQVARRTGRFGDLPWAITRYLVAPERRAQVKAGFRRVPEGFVRDLFIAAPLALTMVQWGLVRQISYQATASVLWWPFALVVISSLISALVLWIALSRRPLTNKGALVKQHLLGIEEFATQTSMLERGNSDNPALPFAALFGRSRAMGKKIVCLIEAELNQTGVSKHWLTSSFLTWSRLLVRAFSLLVVVGAIVVVSTVPSHAPRSQPRSYSWSASGDPWAEVTALEAIATLSRGGDGGANIKVAQTATATFDQSGTRIAQYGQQWPDHMDGQNLDLRVTSITIDGHAVPHVTERDGETLLVRTKLTEPITGTHEVRVEYVLANAAFAAIQDGATVDRVRWAALLDGWDSDYSWGGNDDFDSVRIELGVDEKLASQAIARGWLSYGYSGVDRIEDWPESVVPFDSVTRHAGVERYVLELSQDKKTGWPFDLTVNDLGASFDFPAGTFNGPSPEVLQTTRWFAALPFLAVMIVGGLTLALGMGGVIFGIRRRGRVFEPGLVRDLVRWFGTAMAIVMVMGFIWTVGDGYPDDRILVPVGWTTVLVITASIAALILTKSNRARVKLRT